LSEQERSSGVPRPSTLQNAVTAFDRDGIVVLREAVDTSHCDTLNSMMVKDLDTLFQMNPPHETFPDSGNYVHFPPLESQYIYEDVYANPIAGAILTHLLGPKPELRYIATNTALQATERQPVHGDMIRQNTVETFAITINIPLVDMTLENGATEFWLGTHREGPEVYKDAPNGPLISDTYMKARELVSPPIRLTIPKGSLFIRDMRLWHAGIPNKTPDPRILICMNHFASWYHTPSKPIFPESSRKRVESLSKTIFIDAKYVSDSDYNHLAIEFTDDGIVVPKEARGIIVRPESGGKMPGL